MKIAIIEDEIHAYEYLVTVLHDIDPTIEVVQHCESIKSSVNYLSKEPDIDLILMDIQLADGISFDIFGYVSVSIPVVFVTAFDSYAIEAFKVHSIDYLLKPINKKALAGALTQYEAHYSPNAQISKMPDMASAWSKQNKRIKNRCLVKKGNHFEYVDVENIAFVQSEDSITFLYTTDGRRHLYGKTVEQLHQNLNASTFFQISRSAILHIKYIKEIHPYHNQRLLVKLIDGLEMSHQLVVSRSRASSFKEWVDCE